MTTFISIHALCEEGDVALCGQLHTTAYFYPRPPRGGRPSVKKGADKIIQFLSTPSVRRATKRLTEIGQGTSISIHALREEGDVGTVL